MAAAASTSRGYRLSIEDIPCTPYWMRFCFVYKHDECYILLTVYAYYTFIVGLNLDYRMFLLLALKYVFTLFITNAFLLKHDPTCITLHVCFNDIRTMLLKTECLTKILLSIVKFMLGWVYQFLRVSVSQNTAYKICSWKRKQFQKAYKVILLHFWLKVLLISKLHFKKAKTEL